MQEQIQGAYVFCLAWRTETVRAPATLSKAFASAFRVLELLQVVAHLLLYSLQLLSHSAKLVQLRFQHVLSSVSEETAFRRPLLWSPVTHYTQWYPMAVVHDANGPAF